MQDTERITEVHDTNAFLPCARFLILCGCLWHSVPSQNRMCAWFFFFTRGKFQSGKYSCRVDVPAISHNALKTGYSGTDKLWKDAWHAIQFTVHDVPLNCEYGRRIVLNFIDMILVSNKTSGLQESCAMRNSIIFDRKITFLLLTRYYQTLRNPRL